MFSITRRQGAVLFNSETIFFLHTQTNHIWILNCFWILFAFIKPVVYMRISYSDTSCSVLMVFFFFFFQPQAKLFSFKFIINVPRPHCTVRVYYRLYSINLPKSKMLADPNTRWYCSIDIIRLRATIKQYLIAGTRSKSPGFTVDYMRYNKLKFDVSSVIIVNVGLKWSSNNILWWSAAERACYCHYL